MASVSLFGGGFTCVREIAGLISKKTGLGLVSDREIIEKTMNIYGIDVGTLSRSVWGRPFVFNSFTHEKERSIAHIKVVMAGVLENSEKVYSGYLGHLVPEEISHVLKVLLVAPVHFRVETAGRYGISEKDALRRIRTGDEAAFNWTQHLFDKQPWDSSLYDIVIPTDTFSSDKAAEMVVRQLEKGIVQNSSVSEAKVRDFALAAAVELALAKRGHCVKVWAEKGRVVITIEKKVLLLSMLEKELTEIAQGVAGVVTVETRTGPQYHSSGLYNRYNFELSPKVLLVDDEKDFVHTLSERLRMRDVGTHVVYDGTNAIDIVENEDIEVMVLDLKMPGVDGYEVLRRVGKSNPETRVIILTGHGSAEDRARCMDMGAFAYLQKPAEIDFLTETMKKAYEEIRMEKQSA